MLAFSATNDAWIGAQLGKIAIRVGLASDARTTLQSALDGCDFAYARVPCAPADAAVTLQDAGFRVVDTALSFEANAGEVPRNAMAARFATASDRDAVAAIAGTSFRYSRFHIDPSIPAAVANGIKRDWAGNYFAGARGDAMIVAEISGQIAGFLQVIARGGDCVIDLIATAPSFERRGVARGMIGFLAERGVGQRAPGRIAVGTQAANVPSCRLYECLGFRLIRSDFILHYHRTV